MTKIHGATTDEALTATIFRGCRDVIADAWLASDVPATQHAIDRAVMTILGRIQVDPSSPDLYRILRRAVCRAWDAQYRGHKRRQRAWAHDPLATPVARKAYCCQGRLFASRRQAGGYATAVQRRTQQMTYCGLLSGSYRPTITAVLCRA